MVETARFGKYAGPVFYMETVVEDDPAFVHAAHPEAGPRRCDVAVVDDVARSVWPMGAVLRRGGPHAEAVCAMIANGFDDAIFDEIFVRPAGMPLGVRIVEEAVADDATGGRPLEQRRMAVFKRLNAVDETVPTMLPARVGRSAAALEPCVAEDAVADFAEFRLLAIDGKTAAFDDFHVLRPAVPCICEKHRRNPQIFRLFDGQILHAATLDRLHDGDAAAVDDRKFDAQRLLQRDRRAINRFDAEGVTAVATPEAGVLREFLPTLRGWAVDHEMVSRLQLQVIGDQMDDRVATMSVLREFGV